MNPNEAFLGFSAEFDITIHSPGIRQRFLDWWSTKTQEEMPEDVWGGLRQAVFLDGDYLYRVSWFIPRFDGRAGEAHIPPPDLLFVHIPRNVPMQDFHQNFFKFLADLGIESYELRLPWYADLVKKGVDALIEKAGIKPCCPRCDKSSGESEVVTEQGTGRKGHPCADGGIGEIRESVVPEEKPATKQEAGTVYARRMRSKIF